MYRLSRFAKNLNSTDTLNIQNCINSIGNYIHLMYGFSRFAKNFEFYRYVEYSKLAEFNRKLCTLDVWNVWICRKIELPELRKFNEILCTLDVGFPWICRKFAYLELHKFSRKFYTLDLRIVRNCKKFKFCGYIE